MEQSAAVVRYHSVWPPHELQQVAWGENETFLTLKDGSMLTARLVIGADGANSWLRNKADIPLTFWDYQHHALVATIRTEEPHDAVARQVFHGEGILAFLPLSVSASLLDCLVTVARGSAADAAGRRRRI